MDTEEPTPEQIATWDARDRKAARWLTVALVAAATFVFGYARAEHREVYMRLAGGIGSGLFILMVSGVVAFAASRTSEKWHYAFAVTAAVTAALAYLGSRSH